MNIDFFKKYHFLEFLDCHESAAWIKTRYFLIELSSAKENVSIENVVGEFIPVATEKFEFDNREKSKKISIILTIGFIKERSEKRVFPPNHRPQVSSFRVAPSWKKSGL